MMKKGLKICLLVLFISLFFVAYNNCTKEINYAFAIDGYVKIQKGEIDSINVTDYLPNKPMTLVYKDMTGSKSLQYYYNVYPNKKNVKYKGVSSLDALANTNGGNYTSSGYYYYYDKGDCLVEAFKNKVTPKTQHIPYVIPIGKSLEINDSTTIQTVPYLFTVTCGTGTYKNCIAVLKALNFDNKVIMSVTYYAKGIGAILTVANLPNGDHNFRVTDILIKLTDLSVINGNFTNNFAKENDCLKSPFINNTRYECFETQAGKDVIITIIIQKGIPYIVFPNAVWAELEVNGKGDGWGFINPYFSEKRVFSSVSIQGNELAISSSSSFMYDGTYIQLPDIGTDGEDE